MELNIIYSKNKSVRPLFSESITIDYYDGLTTGLAKLDTTEKWMACNMFMKGLIRKCFTGYRGKVFLMKCGDINDVNYEIVEIPVSEMRYFDDMEDALDQPDQDKEKWLSFFASQKK